MLSSAQTYADQLTPGAFLTAFFYIFASLGVFIGTIGLILLDAGLVQQKNLVDTIVQKLANAMIGGVAFMIIGYGVWNWQFYQAFGIPHPLQQAIADWSLFGTNMSTYAQHLNPASVPGADTQQVFSIFFFVYGAIIGAFIHGAGIERLKPLPCYIMSALAGGIVMPVIIYLTYGSASPLTNNGLHDFVGTFSCYIFVGVWALVLAARLGPRTSSTTPHSFALVAGGAMAVMIAIPMFVVGCGYLQPGAGYFGITASESGLGIIFVNVFMALGAGGIGGALIAYRLRKPQYILLGPIAGYVSCTALFDLAAPWQATVIAFFGPLVLLLGEKLVRAAGIDEPKIGPLALGPGIYSAFMAGIIGAGRPTGGFFGLKDGPYAYLHAHISHGMQIAGIAVTVVITAIVAYVVCLILDKTIGLRVTAAEEQRGLDATYWAGVGADALDAVSPTAAQSARL